MPTRRAPAFKRAARRQSPDGFGGGGGHGTHWIRYSGGMGLGRLTGGALTPGYRVVPQAGLFGRGGEGGAVELTAQADLSAGEALTLCYAEATRGELLLDYGFVAEPVPPEASLRFGVADDDPNYDEKARAGALSVTTCHIADPPARHCPRAGCPFPSPGPTP